MGFIDLDEMIPASQGTDTAGNPRQFFQLVITIEPLQIEVSLFLRPDIHPGRYDVSRFIEVWRKLAKENGIGDIFFVAHCKPTSTKHRRPDGTIERVLPNLNSSAEVYTDLLKLGFDALNPNGTPLAEMRYSGKYIRLIRATLQKYLPWLPASKFDYAKVMPYYYAAEDEWENIFPSIMPQWDRSPRSGITNGIYVNSTPANFKKHVLHALTLLEKKQPEHRILFLRSWNEWAEGNYVEPDLKYGHGFLQALREALS